MVGRDLLPFGDTFAVLMIVFLVLSLAVGRHPSETAGDSGQQPMLVTIGTPDPMGTSAEGLMGLSTNISPEPYWVTNRSRSADPARVTSFLKQTVQVSQIKAHYSKIDDDKFIQSVSEEPFFSGLPTIKQFMDEALGDADLSGILLSRWGIVGTPGQPMGRSIIVGREFVISKQPSLGVPTPHELTGSCSPISLPDLQEKASEGGNLTALGFGESLAPSSGSITLSATRPEPIEVKGFFEAIPSDSPRDEIISKIGFLQGTCFGYKGGETMGPWDGALPCETVRAHPFDASLYASYPLRQKYRAVVALVPDKAETIRQIGSLAFNVLNPPPVEISIYNANGSTRRYRTPTWWEMFKTSRGLAGNRAYSATRAQCNSTVSSFLDPEDIEAKKIPELFDFRLTIHPNGRVDHYDTLIPVSDERP